MSPPSLTLSDPAPAAPGQPLHIVINEGSGRRSREARATIERVLVEAGRDYRVLTSGPGRAVDRVAREAVDAARASHGAVVAAGGDGTLNAVAQAVIASGCPFGVVPLGTFNYFARTHGIPSDAEAATRALLRAQTRPVQVGYVNDRIFLVNASLGLYPRMLQNRESHKKRFGRSRLVAFGSAFATMVGVHRPLHLMIRCDGREYRLDAQTLFIGNNVLQLQQIGVDPIDVTSQLVAISLQPVPRGALLRLALHGALGQLRQTREVESFGFQKMEVQAVPRFSSTLRRRRLVVATDGEVVRLRGPLVFRVAERPLSLLHPAPDEAVTPA